MRRSYFPGRSVLIEKSFDFDKVNEDLGKFSNKLHNGCLVTEYDGREICRVDVSNVYYNFDFTNFSKSILSEIQKYFSPERYSLKAASGVQEIRLIGDELYIDNERYEKMISIVNSTDKSKALSMNVGLIKTKGLYKRVDSITILTSFTNKHYKTSLPDKIKSFSENLINFNMDIDFHIKSIEDLKHNEVSIVNFAKKFLFNEDGKLIKTSELKLNALCKKLMYDGLYSKRRTFDNLTAANLDKAEDFNINSKVLYSAYIQLFKDKDTSVIARESRRIFESLEAALEVEMS